MKIKEQFYAGEYTVLLFEKLDIRKAKYIVINGVKYEAIICFDLPNAIAVKTIGDFVGADADFMFP